MPLLIGYNINTNTLAFASSEGGGGGEDGGGGGGSSSSTSTSSSSSDSPSSDEDTDGEDGDEDGSNDEQTETKKDDTNIPSLTPDNTGADQNQDNKNNKPTCSQGQHYDDTLKTCVNDNNEIKGLTNNQQQCAIGEHFDDKTKTCVKNTPDQQGQGCAGETHFDTKSLTCVDNSKRDYGGVCAPGWHPIADPVYNDPIACEKDKPTTTSQSQINCDPKSSKCIPNCGSEHHYDAAKALCAPNTSPNPDGTCSTGWHLITTDTGGKKCEKDTTPTTTPAVNCDPKYHYDASKAGCISNDKALPDGTCVQGYHPNPKPTGDCVEDTPPAKTETTTTKPNQDGTCPPGYTKDSGTGECINDTLPARITANPNGSCPPGYTKNVGTVECYKNTAPLKTAPNPDGSCPIGYDKDKKGECIQYEPQLKTPNPNGTCPTRYHKVSADKCLHNNRPDAGNTCQPGWHFVVGKVESTDPFVKNNHCEEDIKPPTPQPPKQDGTGGAGGGSGGTGTTTEGGKDISSSSTTINIINKNIIEGNQPIGSSFSSAGTIGGDTSTTTGKLFKEFNDRRNAATGLAVTNTTIAQNQFISGQVDISGRVQNFIPIDLYQMSEAKNIIITATLYDSLNNTIGVMYGASNPNILRSSDSGIFNLIVPNPSSNVDHAVYLVQWIDQNGVMHPSSLPIQEQQQLPSQQLELQPQQ